MRIISGRFKGASLYGPKDNKVRPTSDKVREALFGIIGPAIDGAAFLDLYAGSGAVGLEALSRGAAHVVAVDNSSADLIRKNCGKLGIAEPDEYEIIKADISKALRRLLERNQKFDFIFADPPWRVGVEQDAFDYLVGLLSEGGLLIIEGFHKGETPDAIAAKLKLADARRYGDTSLRFYKSG